MWEFMLDIGFPIIVFFLAIGLVIGGPIVGLSYYQSCREAAIYNAQNRTSYTCWDFFWASDQINSMTQTVKIR